MLSQPACPPETFLTLYPSAVDSGIFALHCDAFRSGQPGRLDVYYQHDRLDNYYHLSDQRAGDLLVVSFTDTADHDRSAAELALRQSQAREQAARAEAEAEAQRQRQRLLNVFAQAPVLMARLAGPDHVVELANEGLQQVLGGQQMIGQPYRQAAPALAGQGFFELLDAVYRTGETYAATEAPVFLPQAGPGPPAPRYFDFVYQATRDAAGRIDGVLIVGHETTGQVRARQLLEEQASQLARLNQELEARVFERTQALRHARAAAESTAQQLRRVTESLPSTSFTADQSGQVLYLSPQWYAYTGMAPGADITAAWPQLIHPDDLPAIAQEFGAALAEGRPWGYEFRLRGADGHYRWFASQGVPEPLAAAEAAGRPRQWFGSNLDIDDLKRAQQQLEEQDQLLTSILSSLPASVVTFEGEDLRFGFFNEAYQHLAQGRLVLGRPAVEVFPEVADQVFLASLRGVLRTGEPYQGQEVPAYARDPHTGQQQDLYLDLAYLPLRRGQQPPHAVLGFIVDVTDRVQARRQAEAAQAQALAAAEQLASEREAFYQVFEQTPALITILRGPTHRFAYFNAAQERVFPGRQLRGAPLAEVLPDAATQGFVALLDQVYATGEPYVGTEVPAYLDQPDGRPARLHYFTFAYQRFEEDGAPAGISVFGTDVTEQVLARRQREAQQVQLHNLFMQAPAPIVILDGPALTYQLVNPAYQQIFPGRELLGRPLLEALPELRGTDVLAQLDQVYQTGETYVVQDLPMQLARRTGGPLEEMYLTFTYQARRDEHGAVDGALVFAYEVTDQVLARQQLAQANAQLTGANLQLTRTNSDLDNFVYTASHDLRQPIANIEGLLTALREELALPPAQAAIDPLLDLMQGAVERFKRTIAQLTDIAKLQAAHDPQPPIEVDLATLVADICQDLRPEFQATGAALTVDVTDCPILAFAEKNLRSVVLNLLSNALKYRHPDRVPQLRLRCHTAEPFTVLEVQDNGLGLDPAQQKKLFGLFQRLHVHVEGTGIGLYMVKKMMENAGGRIEVDSQPSIGSTFRLYFPRSR